MPIGVASRQVTNAICKLTHAARVHSGLRKNSRYQRVDKAVGGNERKRVAENDIGTTMKIGITRKTRTATPSTASSNDAKPELPWLPSIRSSPKDAIEGNKAVHHPEKQQHDPEEHDRDRAGSAPRTEKFYVSLDQLPYHNSGTSAE